MWACDVTQAAHALQIVVNKAAQATQEEEDTCSAGAVTCVCPSQLSP